VKRTVARESFPCGKLRVRISPFDLHLRAGSVGSRSANPFDKLRAHARKTAQQRSFDFAQDFACGFPLG